MPAWMVRLLSKVKAMGLKRSDMVYPPAAAAALAAGKGAIAPNRPSGPLDKLEEG